MPPVASNLTEADRIRVAFWIDGRLRDTACSAAPFAGAPAIRRLNRREYHNTVRDLLGVEFDAVQLFPADGTGGAGFDTNGETLFTPPVLMERYMEAAQEILDRAIVTPPSLARLHAARWPDSAGRRLHIFDPRFQRRRLCGGDGPHPERSHPRAHAQSGWRRRRNLQRAAAQRRQRGGLPLAARLQVRLARGEHRLTVTSLQGARFRWPA